MGSDLSIDFAVAFATFCCCLYIGCNMVAWSWLRADDEILRCFFYSVVVVYLGVAHWSGTNAYLIWFGLNDPPVSTLLPRVFLLCGLLAQVGLTIAVFLHRHRIRRAT